MLLGMSTPGNMQIVQVMGFLVAEPDQPVNDDSKDDDRTSDACHGFTSLSIKDTKWRGTGNRLSTHCREKTRRPYFST